MPLPGLLPARQILILRSYPFEATVLEPDCGFYFGESVKILKIFVINSYYQLSIKTPNDLNF